MFRLPLTPRGAVALVLAVVLLCAAVVGAAFFINWAERRAAGRLEQEAGGRSAAELSLKGTRGVDASRDASQAQLDNLGAANRAIDTETRNDPASQTPLSPGASERIGRADRELCGSGRVRC